MHEALSPDSALRGLRGDRGQPLSAGPLGEQRGRAGREEPQHTHYWASASVPLRGGASLHLISFIVFEAKQSFADAPAIFAIYVLNY